NNIISGDVKAQITTWALAVDWSPHVCIFVNVQGYILLNHSVCNTVFKKLVLIRLAMMQRLLQVPRHIAAISCSRYLSVSSIQLRDGIKRDESFKLRVSNFTAFRKKTSSSQVSDGHAWTSTFIRLYSADRRTQVATRGRGKREDPSHRYTHVEPEKEEAFVFLDYTEPDDSSEGLALTKQLEQADIATRTKDKTRTRTSTEPHPRALELQLRTIKDAVAADAEPDSYIEFHDAGFPGVQPSQKRRKKQQKVYGTPDPEVPVSDSCCTGCGAVMHCTVPDLPGYVPSEKYKILTEENRLHAAICQRCHLLLYHQKALNVQMPKEEYRRIVSSVRKEKALVLLIVDLLDIPDSIIPDLLDLIGENKHVLVLGNKIDLLPGDSVSYLKRIRGQLLQYCTDRGISPDNNIKGIHLISAKTGYGIEPLISSLQHSWKYNGDVYLVGTTNAGKSTLFNTLLESDYCKSKGSDVIRKATISPWPGTTLNLLKFPIINPTPYRMFKRSERLKSDAAQTEADLSRHELKKLQQFSRQGYLVGRVGRTFRTDALAKADSDVVEFDPDSLSMGLEPEQRESSPSPPPG
ncbi:hypothetical protein AAFF_G00435230, partial [Aldrovandia affinis]